MRCLLAFVLVSAPCFAQGTQNTISPSPPLMPGTIVSVPITTDFTDVVASQFDAGKAWKSGNPQEVVAAFETASAKSKSAAFNDSRRDFLEEWILALSFVDMAKADAKLIDWVSRDPVKAMSAWSAKRLVLKTRILLGQGRTEEARSILKGAQTALIEARLAFEAEQKAAKKQRRAVASVGYGYTTLLEFESQLKMADFLIATHWEGEKAFPRFTTVATSPFANSSAIVTSLKINAQTFCTSTGLRRDDWAVVDIIFDRNTRKSRIRPIAVSRTEALKPFVEDAWEWGFTFYGAQRQIIQAPVLVRCSSGAPNSDEGRSPTRYLWEKFKPLNKDVPDDYQFDSFRQPASVLARDGQWIWLVNIASNSNPILPQLSADAQAILAKKLVSDTPQDHNAIDLLRFIQLRNVPAGDGKFAKAVLPDYLGLVAEIGKKGLMPPREMAWLNLRVAQLHEISGDVIEATRIYEAIAARPESVLPSKSPEAIKSRLRLAAIAESSGDKKKAAMIMDQLGLSPDQCSIYQPSPTITKFSMPNFPSDALRNEMQGYVSFEFDMDKAGKATNFRVLASSPPLIFDQRTLSSFAQAEFAPVTRGGSALACEAARTSFVWKIEE